MFLAFFLVAYYYFFWYDYQKRNEILISDFTFEEDINVHEERVYAIDFDGTIAETNYPKIIKPIPYAMEVLRVLTKDLNSTLILWTCREGKYLQDAIDFCSLYGVKFDYVNENCKRNLDMYHVNCRKVSADVYIDDKSYQGTEGVKKLWCDWYNWMKNNDMLEVFNG